MLLAKLSMLGGLGDMIRSWFQKIIDFIVGFFAWIPQLIYFLYTSAASVLDLLQFIIRKLAGLDVYYVDGEEVSGDIVSSFVRGILGIDSSATYSALATVFWSMVIFGAILLVVTTIFAIIKAHYNYDATKSNPFYIIGQSVKSLALMAIVPVVLVFGVYFSNVVLQALDQVTSYDTAMTGVFESDALNNLKKGKVRGTDREAYASYDFFRAGAFTNSTTFSGALFKVAAYDCNRVRLTSYGVPTSNSDYGGWTNFGIFYSSEGNREEVAEQIDFAFANNLTLINRKTASIFKSDSWTLSSSLTVGYSAVVAGGLINVGGFSKYNVGLVWYFYNLWAFNWFIAFAGIIVFLTLLSNVVFGLMVRMIQLLALFFVFPPLIGIAPLDGGGAFTKWRQQYTSDLLMAFGAVIGMNLFFIIMPFLNTISFFNVAFLDNLMNVVIMLAALTMVKNFIATLSGFIGASDANKVGESTKGEVGKLAQKAGGTTLKAASLGVMAFKATGGNNLLRYAGKGVGKGVSAISSAISRRKAEKQEKIDQALGMNDQAGLEKLVGNRKAASMMKDKRTGETAALLKDGVSEEDLKAAGYSDEDIKAGNKKNENEAKKAARAEKIANAKASLKTGAAVAFSVVFGGGKIEHKKDAQGNETNEIDAGKTFKAAGGAVLDVAGAAIKFEFGDLLGGNGLLKTLRSKESGVGDAFRGFVGNFGAVGAKINSSKIMQTEKSKEDAQKEAAGQESAAIGDTATNTKAMYQAIQTLINKIDS